MIRTETEVEGCRKLWDLFTPGKDAWGDWELMYAFHDQDKHRFNFLVHVSEDVPDGLIPLIHDTQQGRYTLMASSYPDGRILWLRYEDFPEFFLELLEKTVMFDLRKSWVQGLLNLHP